MESYDEYAKRARLLAGVHGLTRWSSAPMGMSGATAAGGAGGSVGEGKTPEDEDDHLDKKMMSLDGKKSPTTLPNNAVAVDSGTSSGSGGGKKLGKSTRTNIVRASSKTLDKKSKKKSLKRL